MLFMVPVVVVVDIFVLQNQLKHMETAGKEAQMPGAVAV
jgi:hypothetical protein